MTYRKELGLERPTRQEAGALRRELRPHPEVTLQPGIGNSAYSEASSNVSESVIAKNS